MSYALFCIYLRQIGPANAATVGIGSFFFAMDAPSLRQAHRKHRDRKATR